jgi:hypothetical protein
MYELHANACGSFFYPSLICERQDCSIVCRIANFNNPKNWHVIFGGVNIMGGLSLYGNEVERSRGTRDGCQP